MKKLSILIFILLSIANVACSNKEEKKEVVIKKKEEGSKIPVPVFDDIDLYLRDSYNKVSWDKIRRESYVNESTHLDVRTKELILEGKTRIGMYKEDVSASLGAPDKKIKSHTDFGIKEDWIYSKEIFIFENGILKDIKKII